MKFRKITPRTGFELLFACGIAAIMILPTVVMAQDNKNLEITIHNGDTIINGQNIKNMNAAERRQALNELKRLTGRHERMMLQMHPGTPPPAPAPGSDQGMIIEKEGDQWVMRDRVSVDTLRNRPLHLRRRLFDTTDVVLHSVERDPRLNTPPAEPWGDGMGRGQFFRRGPGEGRMGMMGRRNSENFTFETTDDNGISTRISYRVTTPEGMHLKNIAGVDRSDLEITDLKLVPDFTSGKTTIMFDLPTKAAATAEFTDSEGKTLWEEKGSGFFEKNFALPLNGIYYLKIKQGGKICVKQIFKES